MLCWWPPRCCCWPGAAEGVTIKTSEALARAENCIDMANPLWEFDIGYDVPLTVATLTMDAGNYYVFELSKAGD